MKPRNTLPNHNFHRHRSSGFSMIELLLAAFIMAVGLLGLTLLQTTALNQAANGRGRATAVFVAEWMLQRAQVEGQNSYWAKVNSQASPYTAVFTATPGTGLALATFGGFNVDGVQVTDGAGANLPNIAAQVPDTNKRSPVYTAAWSRRAYGGTAPPTTGAHAQEFVVNVTWTEGQGLQKHLTISRIIRY